MSASENGPPRPPDHPRLFDRLRSRGVLRVAVSYAVIAWLLLQIGDVVLEPLNAPAWTMRAMIVLLATGFPIALALAWYFELGPSGISVDQLPEQSARPAARGVRRYTDGIIIAVLLGVIVLLLARQQGLLEPAPTTPVIAVLPFADLGTTESSHYGDGLADTLIHKLGQVAGLVVLASTSTFEFRGSSLELSEIARKLRADAVLEGSLQRAGGVLRVNARLVDAGTGKQRWSASFNRRSEDLFAVQDEIATAVASALEVVLAPREAERLVHRDTLSLSAFDAYQRGREGIAIRSPEGLASAILHLNDAIASDPEYALAHAALAEAYFLASVYRFDSPWSSVSREARQAAARAQSIDPALGEGYLAEAFAAMGDNNDATAAPPWPEAHIAALLERAVQLSPNNAVAWKFYSDLGDDEALRWARLEKAAQLDPRSGIIQVNLGNGYENLGDLERARQWYVLSIDTTKPYFALGLTSLIYSYRPQADTIAVAARWGRAALIANPGDRDAAWREQCRTLIQLGAWDEVAEMLRLAEAGSEPSGIWQLYQLSAAARLHRARGDLATAAIYAERFKRVYLMAASQRGQAPSIDGPPAAILNVLPLHALASGNALAAVQHYQALYPDMAAVLPGLDATEGLNARLLLPAARKQLGDRETAERELRDYLASITDQPITGPNGTGFTVFAAHAFLGETDAAIAAFQSAIDAGFTWSWWGLKDGAFDADYAAVLADPRYKALFARLEASIAAQREEFRTRPELPLEDLVAAGLTDAPGR